MGLYGNLSNEGKSNLTFDRVYPNKAAMDSSAATDNVFIGRFVLVSYGDRTEAKNLNSKYNENYKKDVEFTGSTRSYDGTVWQKVVENGVQAYTVIADLNTVVPEILINPIAPGKNGSEVFEATLDKVSDLNYIYNIQGNWGFRVKENGINFNEEGFQSNVKSDTNSKEKDNYIKFDPVSSGEVEAYGDDPDTQELTINLPAIGDAVSKMWDIVYGDPGENGRRITDIDWNSPSEIRLVTEKEDGSGFEYNPDNIESLAGAINSTHDLIGRIVEAPEGGDIDIEEADSDHIYYLFRDNHYGYYYKAKKNVFKSLEDAGYNQFDYEDIEAVRNIKNYIDLVPYEASLYHTKKDNNYLAATTEEPYEDMTYYSIKNNLKQVIPCKYEKNKYYYEVGNGYYLEESEKTDDSKIYYDISSEKIISTEVNTHFFVGANITQNEDGITYNGYFITDDNLLVKAPDEFNDTKEYIYLEGYRPEAVGSTVRGESYFIGDKEINSGNWNEYVVNLIEFEPGVYYKQNENGYELIESIDAYTNKEDAYIITPEQITDNINDDLSEYRLFYMKDRYYKQIPLNNSQDFNYYLSIDNEASIGEKYFAINNFNADILNYEEVEPIEEVFYEQSKYYYTTDDGSDVLDVNKNFTENRDYFLFTDVYIKECANKPYLNGSVWSGIETVPPADVILGIIDSTVYPYEWKELRWFARALNTINGLILKINKYCDFNNDLRSDNTVSGVMNQMKDILASIKALKSGRILGVNKYGEIDNMEISIEGTDSPDAIALNIEVENSGISPKIIVNRSALKDVKIGEETLETIIAKINNTLWEIEDKITNKSYGLEQADYTLNSRCNQLDNEVKKLGNNAAILESGLAETQAEVERLTKAIDEMRQYIGTLEERIKALEEQ